MILTSAITSRALRRLAIGGGGSTATPLLRSLSSQGASLQKVSVIMVYLADDDDGDEDFDNYDSDRIHHDVELLGWWWDDDDGVLSYVWISSTAC